MDKFIRNYSIINDTLNKRLNIPELENSILKSEIIASFYQVETNQDVIIITFKTDPSIDDTVLLDIIVAAHQGTETIMEVTPVKIMEEPAYCKMDRTLKAKSIEIASDESKVTVSFPYDIALLGGEFNSKAENVGDRCQFVISPNKTVGLSDAIIGSAVSSFDVSADVLPYMFKGFNLRLTDGTNTDELGEIISINGNTVTFEDVTAREWSVGAQIIIEYHLVPHKFFDAVTTYQIGKFSSSANLLRAGTEIEFRYFDENSITKTVARSFSLEYYL